MLPRNFTPDAFLPNSDGARSESLSDSDGQPSAFASPSPLGVYVHFPFCRKKCPYCDFVSYKTELSDIPHEAYADAIVAELCARRFATVNHRLATVFFGGGTPSLWSPVALGRVLRAIFEAFASARDAEVEVTVECNPTSLDRDGGRALLDVGVNRLSIGVQSLDERRLTFLGREHSPAEALATLEAAIASGMPRVSGDLIFGVATGDHVETPAEAADEARRVATTGVEHVSAYALTIEPNTEFGALAKRGKLPLAPDDGVVDSLYAVSDALAPFGLTAYETSNYARTGAACRHNLGYWRGHDYLGLGAGAFGTLSRGASAVRYRNAPDPRKYMAASARPDELAPDPETVDPEARMNERIMLGLRLAEGIDLEDAAQGLGVDPLPPARLRVIERLVGDGRIERRGSRLVVPRDKRALVDGISAALFV